ncbi:MAG: hypothetical protein KDE19_12400 [Caldilineaceae bacterium]|nr:hypothetical protein [Caldilineaceae bacterium]
MINHEETLGFWEMIPENSPPHYSMALDGGQLAAHWRRCSLTADFWARYIALHIPLHVSTASGPTALNRVAMTDILSYLLNELFENCAKFSSGPRLLVYYQSWLRETEILVQLTNHIQPAGRPQFKAVIQEILDGDADELYFQKLEASVELNLDGSGLGYLTLIKDYGIRFGFRFRPLTEESVAVDVQAHVATVLP